MYCMYWFHRIIIFFIRLKHIMTLIFCQKFFAKNEKKTKKLQIFLSTFTSILFTEPLLRGKVLLFRNKGRARCKINK